MDLFAVMSQVELAVKTVPGLRVKAWDAQTLTPPGALVTLPRTVNYHGSYGTGLQQITDMTVVVIVGKAVDRVALKKICGYVKASGASSVKAALELYPSYTALDNITVTSVDFDGALELDGTEYLAAIFHCNINGPAT
jgi:hypothetical protein